MREREVIEGIITRRRPFGDSTAGRPVTVANGYCLTNGGEAVWLLGDQLGSVVVGSSVVIIGHEIGKPNWAGIRSIAIDECEVVGVTPAMPLPTFPTIVKPKLLEW